MCAVLRCSVLSVVGWSEDGLLLHVFFKQKTAYEVRISDWSSDVCSSDRPDGSDDKSFPSGHTSTSFAAAATLHNRYGWEAGLPAYVVASFVGLSRVEAKRHRVGDVLVGAAIGTVTGHLITTKANDRVHILPWGDTQGEIGRASGRERVCQ